MTLIIELPPEKEAALRAQARAAGLSSEDFALRMLSEALGDDHGPQISPSGSRTPAELIRSIVGDAPPEELAKLPADGSSQVDHYVYRLPKRKQ